MPVDGNWNCTMDTPLGERKLILNLAVNGSDLTGTIGNGSESTPIQDGRADGDTATWKADISNPISMTLEFAVTVTGDNMAGSVKLGMFGNAPLRGTRA
jgi:hypothetical protein